MVKIVLGTCTLLTNIIELFEILAFFCVGLTISLKFIFQFFILKGWWLSLDPKDTFFKRLQPLEDFAKLFEKSERFGNWNSKTLGIVLVCIIFVYIC